jgi:hypothetical protein
MGSKSQSATDVNEGRTRFSAKLRKTIGKVKGFSKYFVLILLVSVIIRQLWIFALIERDEGGLALVGLQWLNGYLPYAHSLNNAGPLAYVVYAFITYFFGENFVAVRLFNNLLFFVSIVCLYLFVRSWLTERIALISSLLYGVFMSAPIYEGQLVLTSSLSASTFVIAVFFIGLYVQNNSKKWLFTASLVISLAALTKVIGAIGLLLVFVAVAVSRFYGKSHSVRSKVLVSDLATLFVGFTLVPACFLAYFVANGALGNIFDVFINKTLTGYQSLPDVSFVILLNVAMQALPLWLFAIWGLCSWKKNKFNFFVLSWLVFALAVAAFPPHFGHRFVYLTAPASILAAIPLSKISFKNSAKRFNRINLPGALTVSLLILSIVIAFSFQVQQYPQYNITSNGQYYVWSYADSDSYSSQIKLSDFLRTHTSPDGKVLVHGWAAEIYFLADKMPPSEYVWTRPDGVTIPVSEVNRLVDSVKNHEFEYVVFFFNEANDSIVNQTLNSYYFLGFMGNAFVYTRNSTESQLAQQHSLTRSTSELEEEKPSLVLTSVANSSNVSIKHNCVSTVLCSLTLNNITCADVMKENSGSSVALKYTESGLHQNRLRQGALGGERNQ